MDVDQIAKWIEPFEGTRSSVYDDATGGYIRPGTTVHGNPTVGIGINLCYPNGLEPEEIQWLFQHRVAKVAQAVGQAFPWFGGLNAARQTAIVDMAYNMGLPTLETFTTFLRLMGEGDYNAAADDLKGTLWYRQAKGRAVKDADAVRTGVLG